MKNRRLTIAGLALVTALGLAGCGPADGPEASGTRAPAAGQQDDAAAALAAAAQKLGEDSLRFDMDMAGSITASGTADPKAGLARMSMDMDALGEGSIELRKVGGDIFMKFDGGAQGAKDGKSWMHVDASKVADGSTFDIMSEDDPAGTKKMISAMTRVERVGERGFQGSLDLAKSPTYNKNDSLKALAGKTLVPFTASTDDQGRLVELTLDMSGLGASSGPGAMPNGGKVKTTYSDFGTKVSVQAPPAGDVKELPAELSGLVGA
jgi:hypothetical protein